uniref:Uncharacterized protein n=1 Tax=Tetradesmus obliquus TaxID=3088 RepID=A0A383W553_TETOB
MVRQSVSLDPPAKTNLQPERDQVCRSTASASTGVPPSPASMSRQVLPTVLRCAPCAAGAQNRSRQLQPRSQPPAKVPACPPGQPVSHQALRPPSITPRHRHPSCKASTRTPPPLHQEQHKGSQSSTAPASSAQQYKAAVRQNSVDSTNMAAQCVVFVHLVRVV